MATLKDIARETGFHVSTVSQVLNGGSRSELFVLETRQAIREAASRLNYRPHPFAQGLKAGRTSQIGIVGPVFGHGVWGQQMRGLTETFRAEGFSTLFLDTEESPEREAPCLREMTAKHVEAIFFASAFPTREALDSIPPDIPAVLYVHRLVPGWPCLMLDRFGALTRTVERLWELGHRRIAFVAGRLETNLSKLDGFAEALRVRGALDNDLVFEFGQQPGAAREGIARHRAAASSATAFVCSNDRFAGETVEGLRDIGRRVPQDASVVGFNDSEVVFMTTPPLASIRVPVEEAIAQASRMVMDALEGRPVENAVLTPRFIERGSVGPYSSAA